VAATYLHRIKSNLGWLEERLRQATEDRSWTNALGIPGAKGEILDLYYELTYFFDDETPASKAAATTHPDGMDVQSDTSHNFETKIESDVEMKVATAGAEATSSSIPPPDLEIISSEKGELKPPADWSCEICTFLNVPMLDTCEMCGNNKPAYLLSPSGDSTAVRAEEKAKRKRNWEGFGNEMLPAGVWDEEEEKSWALLPPKYTVVDWSPWTPQDLQQQQQQQPIAQPAPPVPAGPPPPAQAPAARTMPALVPDAMDGGGEALADI